VINQNALDAFISLDDLLYIFQFTVASKHDNSHGLIDVADQYSFPPRDQWRFVFIILPNLTLTVESSTVEDGTAKPFPVLSGGPR